MLRVEIVPVAPGGPAGKLADAELHFTGTGRQYAPGAPPADEILDGLKLVGFAVWERPGGRNVTLPSSHRLVRGEPMGTMLLRPIGNPMVGDALRDLVLTAYAEWEKTQVPA